MILGIDEVGRGSWAGPLVVGAVVLGGQTIEGLADSKVLSKRRREQLAEAIQEKALGYGLGWVSPAEIDEMGLSAALREATKRAVQQIKCSYSEIIIDGTINFLADTSKGKYVTVLPKADTLIPAVSAAAILAKVARDAYMAEQDEQYVDFQFGRHVGYGTAHHRMMLEKYGATPLHRHSFKPLKDLMVAPVQKTEAVLVGIDAESAATRYLQDNGWQIEKRNWRTRWCEVDIIAVKDGERCFVEVKHRTKPDLNDGLDAITAKKLDQMKRSVAFYEARINEERLQPRIMVITTTGKPPAVTLSRFVDEALTD